MRQHKRRGCAGHRRLSILYLRCPPQPRVGLYHLPRPFNSLFEMPHRGARRYGGEHHGAFNSLFEMLLQNPATTTTTRGDVAFNSLFEMLEE